MESRSANRKNGACPRHCRRVLARIRSAISVTNPRDSIDYKSKSGLKQDELRRRREDQQVEIRRQKREENISKRRNFLPSAGPDSDDESGVGSWESPVRLIRLMLIMLHVLTVSTACRGHDCRRVLR